MTILNKETFKDVRLENMDWERRELEEIIKAKKDELENKQLKEVIATLMQWITEGDINERELTSLMTHYTRVVKDIERM